MRSKQPNILIIHADQHRYDCIGAYGNPDVQTPNIDKLAEDGVLYRNSFCPYPICTPSRYSLITGLYVHQHLGWTNHCTIPDGIETFPRILKQVGYHTKAIGKMHFTPTYLDVGFDDMELAEQDGPGRYDDDYHRFLQANGQVDKIDLMDQVKQYRQDAPEEYWKCFGAVTSDLEEKYHSTTWIGDRAVASLEDWKKEGNMLMVGFIKPHHPFDPPEPWSNLYAPQELSLLPGWTDECFSLDLERSKGYLPNEELTEESLKKVMSKYYAAISQIDYHVGRMIDVLKKKGLYDDTLIIYTSDHGDYMGFHHMVLKGNYMYDPLIKVPLIIKYPGMEQCGVVSEALINNIDLSPTILRQAGCPAGHFMKGIDVAEDMNGRNYIFAENWMGSEYMVRTKTRKLLLCKDIDQSQYFNLEVDPMETNNLFHHAEYHSEIEEHISVLNHWILFDAVTPVYLNENGSVITSKNVPDIQDSHREEAASYFKAEYEKKNVIW